MRGICWLIGPALGAALVIADPHSAGAADVDVRCPGPIAENPPASTSSTRASTAQDLAAAEEIPPSNDQPGKPNPAGACGDVIDAAHKGIATPSGITVLGVNGLTGAIMGRLDGARGAGVATPGGGSSGGDGMMGLGMAERKGGGRPGSTVGPLTVYATGTLLGGDSHDTPNAAGFSYDATAAILGLEYSVSRNLIIGAAASFTRMDTDLSTGASTDADVLHAAAYLSYATRVWFIDALATYGIADLDMTRPGLLDAVHSSTETGAVGLTVRGGYLFDAGKVRVGPIAGLSYVGAKVDGYTEAGADPTAMTVDSQSVESLTGSAGIRFLAPFHTNGLFVVPYLNVTLEHQFGSSTGSTITSLVQAPGTPVSLAFPIFNTRDYGKVEGGVTVELAPEASLSLSGASTFARDDGHDFRINAGLNYRF